MTYSQIRDYTTILRAHHLPYFAEMTFDEICSRVQIKKYVVNLRSKKNRYGQPFMEHPNEPNATLVQALF